MFGLFESKKEESKVLSQDNLGDALAFVKYDKNPILVPDPKYDWKAKAVYNPAAIYLDNKVHLIYRAQDNDNISCFGYASSLDGYVINEDINEPIYRPSQSFELPTKPGWNAGCEDPRITKIGERLYMTYTAYDGTNPPRVALTSISVTDFLNKNFLWDVPKLISPPGVYDKDACIMQSQKGLVAFHRIGDAIWMDKLKDLEFPEVKYLTGGIIATARRDSWDNIKIGMAAPPIEIEEGLLVFYHAVSDPGFIYKIGAMILDRNDYHRILARSDEPLIVPEFNYEKMGQIENVVYSCGAVVIGETLFLYYGGSDTVTCVATIKLQVLINALLKKTYV